MSATTLATAWPTTTPVRPRPPGSGSSAGCRATPSRDQARRPGVGAEVVQLEGRDGGHVVGRGRPDGHETRFGACGRLGVGAAQVERLRVAQLDPLLGDARGPASRRSGRPARPGAGTPRGTARRPAPTTGRVGGELGRLVDERAVEARAAGVVPREVDLLAAGVGRDHEVRRRRRRSSRPRRRARRASRRRTPGCRATKPSVRAVTSPTRRPVNGPGPTPTAIAVRSWRTMPGVAQRPVDQRGELLGVLHRTLGGQLDDDVAPRRGGRR